jgi:hypothetical protein
MPEAKHIRNGKRRQRRQKVRKQMKANEEVPDEPVSEDLTSGTHGGLAEEGRMEQDVLLAEPEKVGEPKVAVAINGVFRCPDHEDADALQFTNDIYCLECCRYLAKSKEKSPAAPSLARRFMRKLFIVG